MATILQRSREKRPSEKAYFHDVSGAGKSRVLREFFSLSAEDEAAIERELGVAVDVNLSKAEGR